VLRVAEHFERSDTGRQRKSNEDAYYARAPLFAVADGMGGAQAGEVASGAAIEVLQDGLPDGAGSLEERLAGRVREANARIHGLAQADEDRAGMGTTLSAVYVGECDLTVAHVGDSRVYLLRDGELERLSRDHSLVDELVREGRLTPEEAEHHPQRSIITRALGPEGDVEVDTATHRARDGDVVLICSDGLTSMISEGRVADVLRGAGGLQAAGRALIDAANAAGGRDNITVVLLRIEEVHPEGADGVRDPATEQHTHVGAAALRTGEVRAAVSAAGGPAAPAGQRQRERVAAREPKPAASSEGHAATPREDAPGRGAGVRRGLRRALVAALLVAPLLIGAYFASQTVYFLGASDDGFVTLYRGLPYDLPVGAELYTRNFETGVPVQGLPAPVRRTVTEHKLRAFDDATDLVKRIERGELAGQ
jgi:serine/threonine protein phosphatase PrpC